MFNDSSGGGFFLVCENVGRRFDHSFPACSIIIIIIIIINIAVFVLFVCCCFFFYVEISSRALIPLFMPGSVHSGSASRDDCGRVSPDKLLVSSFSW